MTDENIKKNAQAEIAMAKDALRVATAAVGLGICRDAMSRTYYAAFHAARALVLLAGYEAKTHAGLRHLFSEHIVRPGILEARFNLMLVRLHAYREASDYGYSFELGRDDVVAEIENAREFVDIAERHLAQRKNV